MNYYLIKLTLTEKREEKRDCLKSIRFDLQIFLSHIITIVLNIIVINKEKDCLKANVSIIKSSSDYYCYYYYVIIFHYYHYHLVRTKSKL